jgi:hypothetical protein
MQKKIYICLLLVLASWLFPFSAYTQTYPVTISTQLTQPSPIYLSNYANTASINSPIKVQLILNDLTIMNRQVRLKCYFQGAVSFVSNDFVVGAAPIYLEGGFPTQLTNVELGPYFEYQNLQGVNPNQYAQPLPEGIYTLSFEVYDFATNKKLSKKSSVTTIIFQNEPPFLNLPANKAEIVEQNIQNIIFSWTPRSINVSNVEYEFSLVEIWNTNTPLQNAFAYSQPLYSTTTRNTTVQYSITEPQLIPGKTYAWRVKAKALVGAEEIGVFKNNGYSEIFPFKYLTFCKAPLAITTTDVSQDQAKVTWSGEVDNYDYQVNYREKNADSKWYPLVTPREYATISNLKPKTTYEYTVGAACDPGEYTHSNIQEFTTLAQDEIAFAGCGIKPDPAALSNKTPLPALFPNDVVTAGDFPIVVLKSTGSNGTFSGEGYVTLPFLEKFKELIDAADALGGDKVNIGKYSRIRITFNNIGINTDFKLISGEIVASYDPNWGSMADGDKLVEDGNKQVEELFGPQTGEETPAIPEEKEDNLDLVADNEIRTDTKTETTAPSGISSDNTTENSTGETKAILDDNTANNSNPVVSNPDTSSNSSTGNKASDKDYFIEYKGTKYYNGGTIKIPYKRSMLETFEMKTVESDAKVDWTIHEVGKQEIWRSYMGYNIKTNLPIEDPSQNSANLFKLDLQADALDTEGKPKVRIGIEKIVTTFTQKDLIVTQLIKDKNKKIVKTNRTAKASETLYFVNKPTLTDEKYRIVFEGIIKPNLDLNTIPKEFLKWSSSGQDLTKYTGQTIIGKADSEGFFANEKVNFTMTSSAGYPTMTHKSVDVKWVDEGLKKIDIGNKLGPVLKIFDEINYWQDEFKVFGIPCKVAVLENLQRAIQAGKFSFSYEKKNEEDNKSRYYNKVDKFKFSASGAEMFNLSCGKDVEISIPFTSKKLPIVSANFGVSAGLKGNIEVIKETQIETNKTSYNKSKVSGGGYVTPFLSASIVGVQGKVDMETGIKFEYPYKSNPVQVGIIFYTSDITGKVEISKDVSVFVTESFSYQLFRLDTKKEIEVFKIDINTLTE